MKKAKPALPGFYADVTLTTVVSVRLRKVDLTAMQEAAFSSLVMGAHAEPAGDVLRRVLKETDTPAGEIPDELLNFPELILNHRRDSDVALLRASCTLPTLDGLVELYRGDMALPDLGLGLDYSLLAYVRQHSRVAAPGAREVAQATMFPAERGDGAGRDGEALREAAE
ncbi:hypothetical protein [Deinococcus yunweiensis]|uniref:hypothetical protein n=1 Tax=Deinococcus yunweiensis TaxID=367282 RepID=UPI00398F40E4